ncbi:hypothetical protein DP939_19555 [Spongiactinospora rosea]|uniref:XRE family transcriptional regulator n=1 Tax=Spongiactinospora rosea TaxID=2248750 RepID=A0A366LXI5_9ACTN|nr:hypothetical protein DP939_19555 [Spongiactinospora rosea]
MRLRAERKRRRWGRTRLAQEMLKIADPYTLPKLKSVVGSIRGHETGRHHPSADVYRPLYARIYGRTDAHLFGSEHTLSELTVGPTGTPDADASEQLAQAMAVAEVERLCPDNADKTVPIATNAGSSLKEPVIGGAQMKRRAATQILAALTAGVAIPLDALETLLSALGHELGMADDYTLDDWDRTVHEYACALPLTSPAALIGVLAMDIASFRGVIDRRPEFDLPRAHRVGARLAALMAMALTETGDFATASRWWRIARRAAESSRDEELATWVLGRHALVAQTIGMKSVALALADDAERLAGGRPYAGVAEACAARAKIFGFQDPLAARRALDDLDGLFGRLPESVTGERVAVWGYPEERLLSCRTGVLTALGDAGVADDLADEMARSERIAPRAHTRAELKLAWYLAKSGDREGVGLAVRAMAALPADQHTTAIRRMGARVHGSLTSEARLLPEAQDLRALVAKSSP